jgi:hypothetical protein
MTAPDRSRRSFLKSSVALAVAAPLAAGQNRALVYDPERDLVLLVLRTNHRGESRVYALRYRRERPTP